MFDITSSLQHRTGHAISAMIQAIMFHYSPWWGVTPAEMLGDFVDYHTIRYYRQSNPECSIWLKDITLQDWEGADLGNESVVAANESERSETDLLVPAGGTYSEDVSHTFSQSTSLLDQIDTSSETTFEAAWGGATGAKVSAKEVLKLAYSHAFGSGTQESDTITRHISQSGPFTGKIVAERTLNKAQRHISCEPRFEHSVTIDKMFDDASPAHFDSWAQFCDALRGEAPDSVGRFSFSGGRLSASLGTLLSQSGPYASTRVPEDEMVANIDVPGSGRVVWVASYDNIVHQDITIEPSKGA